MLTYRDGVLHHFTAAITTAETAARNREKLLRDFVDLPPQRDRRGRAGAGPRVSCCRPAPIPRAPSGSRGCSRAGLRGAPRRGADHASGRDSFPAGTFVVPVAQPGARLLRNLLDPHVAQPDAFVKEQERRRKKRLGDQIYDVTAWSLPLAFDVEVVASDRATA